MHLKIFGKSGKGFTLIELMMTLAIVGVISTFAYPAYNKSVTKTRRVAAIGCLAQYANYMEQFYTTNLRYDHLVSNPSACTVLPQLECASTQQTGVNYSYKFASSSPTPSTFLIQAVPKNNQATDDKACGTLGIDQIGKHYDSSGEDGGSNACW